MHFRFGITVFEIGSLLCALAPSMDVLILGRAIQGKHNYKVSPIVV